MKHFIVFFLMLPFLSKASVGLDLVENGVIDLRKHDFSEVPLFSLKGTLKFYPNKTAYAVNKDSSNGLFLQVPDNWSTIFNDGKGYGTYSLTLLKNQSQSLAITFDGIASSVNIYRGGMKVYSSGVFGRTLETSSPTSRPGIIYIPSGTEVEILLFEVSNFQLYHGGLSSNLLIGTRNQVVLENQRKQIRFFFMLGAILLISIFHMSVFGYNRDNRDSLVFGFFCLVIICRTFIFEGFLMDYYPDFPWSISVRMDYLSLFISPALFYYFFYKAFPFEFSKRFLVLACWCSGILSFSAIFTPLTFFTRLLDPYQLLLLVYGFLIIKALIISARKKRIGAVFMLSGFCIFFLTIINDILYADNLIHTFPMISYGIFLFILNQSFFLARQFVRSFQKIKLLTFSLRRTNRSLSRFVPDDFLHLLGKDSITQVNLNDLSEMNMTIMFSDIRAFTELSEKLSPKEAFQFINEYLAIMGPVIRKYGGFIDKYIGDGIMALFPGSPYQAILAGKEMLIQLSGFNKENEKIGKPSIQIGIGIHTGNCILGTIGEAARLETTVISDSVNLAARIEGLTKHYKCNFIVSEETLADQINSLELAKRFIGIAKVKGKSISTKLFEIVPDFLDNQYVLTFDKALNLYFEKDFQACQQILKQLAETGFSDGVRDFYLERCTKFQAEQVDGNWSAIEVFEY